MSEQFRAMVDLVARYRGEKNERLRLAKLKEVHRRTLAEVGDQDIDDPRVQKLAADAQLGLALVEARLARLQVPDAEFDQIEALRKAEATRFNGQVLAARAKVFEDVVRSQLPFFDGDEPACREWLGRVQPPHPVFRKFDRALYHNPTGPKAERDAVKEVGVFVTWQEKYSKLLGLRD